MTVSDLSYITYSRAQVQAHMLMSRWRDEFPTLETKRIVKDIEDILILAGRIREEQKAIGITIGAQCEQEAELMKSIRGEDQGFSQKCPECRAVNVTPD